MKDAIAQRHDAAYKRLFSHPEMVADLLRHWVREPWAGQVRLETLRKVPSEFVTTALRRRASDCVWTFEPADGEPFCLLLEFQSSVDRWMALRMLIYLTQLHEQALRFHKKPRVLSRIASAVVYNGTRSWTASREFASLRGGDSDDSLSVQFRYLLVDGDGFNERGGLVGLVFALERAGEKDFPGLVRKLAQSLKAPQRAELRRSFEAWLTGVLLPRRLDDGLTAEIESLEDAMIHLPERITWTEEARLAGLAEGRREGMVALARSILEKRFGKLSKRTVQRLRDADTSHLAEWTEKASLCRTLREVFEE